MDLGTKTSKDNITITGTQQMLLNQQGSLLLFNSGYHAYGSDITGLSSVNAYGLHMQVASNIGTILNYNYSTNAYGDININSTLFVKSSNSSVGVGTNSPSCPLHVQGTNGVTTASGFGYLNGGGAGGATGFSNRQFSILTSGGICCQSGEIDVISDLRLKQQVAQLDSDLSERFVREINPIQYAYSVDPNTIHYGYGAQDLVKHGYSTVVGYTAADEPLPEETIQCTNGDILSIPSDTRLIVNMLSTIPLLHRALRTALERIDEQQDAIKQMIEQINSFSKPTRRGKK
ncbi:hypothetical protein LEN26_013204 [Aphanomyces euteiches]|nr:hypothetical protein AeMF1_016316 [Aphanomyces euteiches]KAH9112970.1 hypothetical protein LEN26_013204 [Aphanomyces euteiches]KAH9179406.1 hypothetical protein AeNC1_017326 [Aphanomyces euteiches]